MYVFEIYIFIIRQTQKQYIAAQVFLSCGEKTQQVHLNTKLLNFHIYYCCDPPRSSLGVKP